MRTAPVGKDVLERSPDRACGIGLAYVIQHQQGRQQQRRRVRHVLAGDVRCAAVHRLEDRRVVAKVRAWHDAEPTDETRAEVGHDVAVEVGQHQHVERLRLHHELHARRIDDALVVADVGVQTRHVAHAAQK